MGGDTHSATMQECSKALCSNLVLVTFPDEKGVEGLNRSNTLFSWCSQPRRNDRCCHRGGRLQQPGIGVVSAPEEKWAVHSRVRALSCGILDSVLC